MTQTTATLNLSYLRREREKAFNSGKSRSYVGSTVNADGAVTTGEVVGSLITFENAGGWNEGGMVMSIILKDEKGTSTDADLYIYSAAPATIAHSTALAESAAEFETLVGIVSIASADWEATGATGKTAVKGNLGFPFRGQHLYGRLVARAGLTYSDDDIQSIINVIQD